METRKKWYRYGSALALLLLLVAGAVAWYRSPDPQVARVQQMQQQLFTGAGRELPAEGRKQAFQALRSEMEKLSPEQRKQVWQASQEKMQQTFAKKLDDYFRKSKKDQITELDQMIDQMERWGKDRKGKGGSRGGPGKGPAGATSAGGQGRKSWKSMSAEERDQRRKNRLDRTTPEFRGKVAVFRQHLNERRKQRGLPEMSRRGPW